MASKVKDTDRGYKRIKEAMAQIGKSPVVKIGIQGVEADEQKLVRNKEGNIDESDLDLIDIATIHEYGLGAMPERSFLRDTLDENRRKYSLTAILLGSEIIHKKMDVIRSLEIMGEKIKSDIQKRIAAGIGPANDPATIQKKGSSKPLIDTGQLWQSITWLVEEEGGKE